MKERIRELAFESAGGLLRLDERGFMLYEDELEKFAELVRADEREACAKVCDEILEHTKKLGDNDAILAAISCAVAILARGEK